MTEQEIWMLVRKLEQCEFSPGEFHHRDHLAVAAAYLYETDFEAAMNRMRASLFRFISHHGLKGYHETITRFWMEQVEQRIDRRLSLPESVELVQSCLCDKELVYQYYSKERLNSVEAQEGWILPDQI